MPAAPSLSRYAAAARRTASNQTLERFLRRCASGDIRVETGAGRLVLERLVDGAALIVRKILKV